MAQKTLALVTLALGNIDYHAYGSQMSMMLRTGKLRHDWKFLFLTPGRMAIDVARNACVKMAQDNGADAIFFWDDDTLPGNETLSHMLKVMFEDREDVDILMPLYFIRGDGIPPMAFRMKDDNSNLRRLTDDEWEGDSFGKKGEDGLVRVAAVGNGCTLFKMSIFEKVKHPYFLTRPGQCTEDIYFFSKLMSAYPEYGCYMDTRVTAGHIVDKLIVDGKNYKEIRSFYNILAIKERDKRDNILEYIHQFTKTEQERIIKDGRKAYKQNLNWFKGKEIADGEECDVPEAAGDV